MTTIEQQKIIEDKKLIVRLMEVLRFCDEEKITDAQGINKLMKSSTKYMQKRFALQDLPETEEKQ